MNEKLVRFFNKPYVIPSSIGVVAFGAGLGLGYILGKRNRYEVLHTVPKATLTSRENEIGDIEEDVVLDSSESVIRSEAQARLVNIDRPFKVTVGEDFLAERLAPPPVTISEEPVTRSIFAEETDDWNYDLEEKKRSTHQPYVLHKDEFFADEKDYTQSTFTYYAGDDILCDEDDSPIYNHNDITGPLLFGHGSSDPNVVYIRNDKRKSEYEILFDQGLYSREVLGLEIEDNQRVKDLKHSRYQKFREE